jgi:2-polyprenyl-6-methoxyphenol hydroxylase-like FAD-dependent oxidoreductase
MRPLSIAVAGAGIGGLAAAALLARAGHGVTVFDRFAAPAPVGSGLVVQPVGQAVLDLCGAGDAARALGARIGRMSGVEVAAGRTVLDVTYDRHGRGRFGLAMHRAALFQVLLQAAMAAGTRLRAGAAVRKAVTAPGRGFVLLDGGQQEGPFDLIVDACGAGSVLSPLRARPLGYGAVWGSVPWPQGTPLRPDRLEQRYRAARQMAGVLPLGHLPGDATPLAAVFWSLPLAALDGWGATDIPAWKAEATALWPDMAPFLSRIQRPQDMTPARYSHGTLARPWSPGLVHIGDAAHRASPQLGQGANMALLDALALATALQRETGDAALALYARMRRRHVRFYQGMSAAFTPQYQSDSRILPVLRDRLLMPVSRIPPVPAILTRLVGGDLIPPLAGTAFPGR